MSQFKQLLSPLFRRFRGSTKNVEQAELKEDNLDSKENNLEDQDRRQVSNPRGKIQKFRRIFFVCGQSEATLSFVSKTTNHRWNSVSIFDKQPIGSVDFRGKIIRNKQCV